MQPVERLGRDDEPITVAVVKVQQSLSPTPINPQESKFVAVRPCGDKKSYLGMCLGDLPLPPMVAYSPKSQTLFVNSRTNPAMWVPDLNKVVWGYESWWGPIKSEEHLHQISDADIQDVWYVKALKMLADRAEEEDAAEEGARNE